MLVIEKEVKRRVDLVVIPDEVFNVFLDTHVHRNIPQRTYRQETTVIVSHSNDWSGIPRDGEIADFLTLAIRKQRIEERRMLFLPMPHMVFSSLRVRMV